MNNFENSFHCSSRVHCITCRANAGHAHWPAECPHGITPESAKTVSENARFIHGGGRQISTAADHEIEGARAGRVSGCCDRADQY